MRLVLFSSPDITENTALYKALFRNASGKYVKNIAYIPSWYSQEKSVQKDFQDFQKQLPKNVRSELVPMDQKLTSQEKQNLQNFDAIFIDGGNTFFLLNSIKENRLVSSLKKFAENKIIGGVSAGGIILTPNIGTAEVPSFSADDNFLKIKDFSSLSLVNFEFSPHFAGKKKEVQELTEYVNQSNRPLFACEDGAGIVVTNHKIQTHGNCVTFNPDRKG